MFCHKNLALAKISVPGPAECPRMRKNRFLGDKRHYLTAPETEHYLAENFIFDDRQYEQHARRRREISFSSVEFESLSFGSEENELGACVMLIWWGPSKKHRFSTRHDLRRARSRSHPSSDLCENLMDQISQVYIFCQKSFKSVTASAFELLSNHSMTHARNPKRSGHRFYN